nr:hypothetical protein [Patescibacteria group bacterium]
ALETLSVPEFPLLESVGNYFMAHYACDCTALETLSVPEFPLLESVGTYFMFYYAYNCTALETLILPKPGYLHNSSTNLGISSGRIGYLKGYVIDPDDLDDWKGKTSEGGFLYINKIQDPDDVVLLNP